MLRLSSLLHRTQHHLLSPNPSSPAMKTSLVNRTSLPYLAIFTIILFTLISYIRSFKTDEDSFSLFSSSDPISANLATQRQTRTRSRIESKHLSQTFIPLQSVLQLAHSRLSSLSGTSEERSKWTEVLGLNLGEIDLETYREEMEDVWERWFVSPEEKEGRKGWLGKKIVKRNERVLEEVMKRLSLLPEDSLTGPGDRHSAKFAHISEKPDTNLKQISTFPKSIYTTAYVPPAIASPDTSPASLSDPTSSSTSASASSSETQDPPTTEPTQSPPPNIFPDQFHSWAKVNPEWTVKFFDDEGIWRWMNVVFGRGSGQVGSGGGKKRKDNGFGKITRRSIDSDKNAKDVGADKGLAPLLEEYANLPLGVLKADFFRYLVLLIKGGVYTDTDTACVRPLEDWPGIKSNGDGYETISDGMLDLLPELMKLAGPVAARTRMPVGISKITAGDMDTIGDESDEEDSTPINLIVSIESDAPHWKESTFVRGIQLVQWTFAARPGHPVLLDTLGRILSTASSVRSGQIDRPPTLDFTGPGVFSDAVFRYLLARWGVQPHQVVGRDRPLRVGDVLILPMHSFRADASEGDQPDGKLVWHGFFGSWKGKSE